MESHRKVEDLFPKLVRGRQLLREKHIEEGLKKLGNLRAGNSGALLPNGKFIGACPHVAHLRQLGIELEVPDDHTLIMFQMGVESENAVFRDLEQTLAPDELILREDEIPVVWKTANGTIVSGRPDGVVCRKVGNAIIPQYGIELKTAASFWTARDVLPILGNGGVGEPKLSALIQAAHYAWKLNVPYKLSYKSYVNHSFPGWSLKYMQVPGPGEPNSHYLEYNNKGDPTYVRPFEVVYSIDIDDKGQVYYKIEGNKDLDWTRSIVNVHDIERYYEFVSSISQTGKLGTKLWTVGCTGEDKNYSHCDRYCPVHMNYSQYEHDYNLWLDKIREGVTNVNRSK